MSELLRKTNPPGRATAFTLVELLVVIGVIALLLSLLLPALARARSASRAITCASQLREIGNGMVLYSQDHKGWIPRTHYSLPSSDPSTRHPPYWMFQLGPYIEAHPDWAYASRLNPIVGDWIVQNVQVFNCAEHPFVGEIPGTYIINQFSFITEPDWKEEGPVKLTEIRNPLDVVWVTEAANDWGHPAEDLFITGGVRFRAQHDAWHPEHLPGAEDPRSPMTSQARITAARHLDASNVLFYDGSGRKVRRGAMTLSMFDDGRRTPNRNLP